MAHWQQQALIEAPVESIWELLSDPSRYPEWAGDSIETTGVPTRIEKGSTFRQKSPSVFGLTDTTTFEVVELDDLREIKLQCQKSGYYSHWRLTEARGETFADVELGVEPIGLPGQVARIAFTKRALREVTHRTIEGLRRAVGAAGGAPRPPE